MGLKPGTRLGVFEVLSPLGAGGMGEVYLARDTELKREVAIEALPDPVAQDAERVKRFEREARLLASINHPNIGSIFGLERRDDQTFLILELVPGEALGERLDAGSMSLRDILTAFKQIAQALEAAHAQGIVHRDLKPDNVKITPEGLVKVLDFGLAKPFVAETPRDGSKTKTAPSRMTRDGHILGTPAYMSPEQARGEVLDKRTDIWSFGCCLYEALAGRHPFSGSSISEMLSAVLTAQPDYDALPRAVPRNTRYLLRRCLEKDVKRRLHDIGDARIEIEDILEWEGLGLPDEDEERAPGLSPWIAAGLAFATLFVLGFRHSLRGMDDRTSFGRLRSRYSGRAPFCDRASADRADCSRKWPGARPWIPRSRCRARVRSPRGQDLYLRARRAFEAREDIFRILRRRPRDSHHPRRREGRASHRPFRPHAHARRGGFRRGWTASRAGRHRTRYRRG